MKTIELEVIPSSEKLSTEERSIYLEAKAKIIPTLNRVEKDLKEATRLAEMIRDKRLYREDHATFEEFCRIELGKTRQGVNKAIRALNSEKSVPAPKKDGNQKPPEFPNPEQNNEKSPKTAISFGNSEKLLKPHSEPEKPAQTPSAIPPGYKRDGWTGRIIRDLSGYNPYTESVKAKPKPCQHCNGTGVEP